MQKNVLIENIFTWNHLTIISIEMKTGIVVGKQNQKQIYIDMVECCAVCTVS